MVIFIVGMLTCIISSFFAYRETKKESNIESIQNEIKKYFIRIGLLLVPIIVMLFITNQV